MSTNEIRLYDSIGTRLGDDGAQEFVGFIKSEINNEIMDLKDVFLTKADKEDLINSMKDIFLTKGDKVELIRAMKEDKAELTKAIYVIGLVQFLAIVATVIGIFSFMLSHIR
ncbi:MAG TPA: hypothetical protein VD996_14555 [Chitinophagaceae bacterium]|nr:hypothetical protein [Chitinophagaceae bacterium]